MNLVKFYGCLEHGNERIVVAEYVPNGTLREHLDCEFSLCGFTFFTLCELEFLKSDRRTTAGIRANILSLAVRLDIAIDVAHAITYLHMYTGIHIWGDLIHLSCQN